MPERPVKLVTKVQSVPTEVLAAASGVSPK